MHFDRQILFLAFLFAAERVSGAAIERLRPREKFDSVSSLHSPDRGHGHDPDHAMQQQSKGDLFLESALPTRTPSRYGTFLHGADPRITGSASRAATRSLPHSANPNLNPSDFSSMLDLAVSLSLTSPTRSSTPAEMITDVRLLLPPHHELRQATGSGPTASGETAFGATASGETASGPTASGELFSGPTASGETAFGPTATITIAPVSLSSSPPQSSESAAVSSDPPSQSSQRSSQSSDPPSRSLGPSSSSSALPSQSSFSNSSSSTTRPTSHPPTIVHTTLPTTHTTHTLSLHSTTANHASNPHHTTKLNPTSTSANATQQAHESHPISNASVAGIASGIAASAVLVSLAGLYLYRRKKQGKPLFGPRGSTRSTGSYYPKSAWLYDPQPSPNHNRAGSDSGQNLIPNPRPDTAEMDAGFPSPDMRPSRSSSPLLPPTITVSRDESPGGSPGGSPRRSGGRRSRPMMSINEEDE